MKRRINIDRIYSDILHCTQLIGAEYSESILNRVFESFEDKFSTQVIDLKTTTKPLPKRGFYFRYLEENGSGLAWDRANSSRLLVSQNRSVDRLVPDIYETFPLMADGVDFEVNFGLTKIWQFPKQSLSLEETFKITSLPKSVSASAKFFKKYHLDVVHLFAADYQHNSMNLYFTITHPEYKTTQLYRNLLQELNFEVPSDEILNILTKTGSMAFTFNWVSHKVERLCCYVGGFDRENTPKQVNLILTKFVQQCPALVDNPDFILGWSFGSRESSGTYIKMEIDYSGDVLSFFYKLLESSHSSPSLSNIALA